MAIRFFDMFAGIGGFRSGLEAVGGFECMRHLRPARHSVRIDSCVYKRIQTAMPEIISVTITIEFKDIAHVVCVRKALF